MVGQLIRLKLRIIWNTVRRQTAVLVLAVLGTVQFGTMYVGALVGTAFLARSEEAQTLSAMLPVVGPAVFILWLILPILFASMDNSLDPVRLSPYVGPSKRLGAALAASTVVGPGGLLSAMFLILPAWFALWRAQWFAALGVASRRGPHPTPRGACGRARSGPGSLCASIVPVKRTWSPWSASWRSSWSSLRWATG